MRARRAAVLALGVFAAAAALATWPLVLTPGRAIAGGPGDPMLTTAILAWDADRIAHGLRGFWDAPWLFPHRHSLAYAEHLIGIALFTAPIQWITGSPILTYNIAYVGSYVFAGFGMFLLARALWGRTDAAVLAGLAFELTPYRLAQSSHLQMLINGWMPIGLKPSALAPHAAALRQLFAAAGRSAPEIAVMTRLPLEDRARTADLAHEYREAGATRLVHGSRYADVAEFARQVDSLAESAGSAARPKGESL